MTWKELFTKYRIAITFLFWLALWTLDITTSNTTELLLGQILLIMMLQAKA